MPDDHTHVSYEEALDAQAANVGSGTAKTAMEMQYEDEGWKALSMVPSRKWVARTLIAVAGLVSTVITSGDWNQEHSLFAVTIVVAAATSYLVPNEDL